MTKPVRLRLSRAKGFDLQAHSLAVNGLPAVNVARPTGFGNPFVGEPTAAVDAYRQWLKGHCSVSVGPDHPIKRMAFIPAYVTPANIRAALSELRGKNLACWCALDGRPCHADVLLDLANAPEPR